MRRAIAADQLASVIFYGPPGTGKTTLARVIANHTKSNFLTLNAVLTGVQNIRDSVKTAEEQYRLYGRRTILFVDEVHRWNKSQQDALLPWVENGTIILIGATTENPFFEVNKALVSRSRVFQLRPLTEEDLKKAAVQALNDKDRGYGNWKVVFEEGALDEADAVPEQSKISRSLDDLIADIDFDDEGTGLEEDDTSASDFFAQNPFRSSNGLKAAPVEDDFDPEEDYAFEDEEEEEEKPAPKPKKREVAPEVESTDSDLEEPAEEVEDGIFADDEDFEADGDPADLGDPEESDGFEAEDISEPEEDSVLGDEEFEPAMELDEEDEMEDGLSDEPVPEETLPDEFLPEETLPDDIDDTDINDGEEFSTDDFEEVPEEDAEDAPDFEDEPEAEDAPEFEDEPEAEDAPAAIEESTDVSADAPADAPDSSVSLFEKLRSLSDHLPDAKRQEFLESRIKVQLDYIISRLRGASCPCHKAPPVHGKP